MANSRIKDLANEVISSEIQALLDTLYLAVDATSFTVAKKILVKTLLTNAVVENNANDYQFLTPKGFYDSVMTNARKGIGQISADNAVTAKTGSDLLTSVHQVLMQAQWKQDFFKTLGNAPASLVSDTGDLATANAIAYQTCWAGTLSPTGYAVVSPVLPNNRGFKHVFISFILTFGNIEKHGSYALTGPAVGAETDIQLGNNIYLYIYDYGRSLGFTAYANCPGVKISATINGTLQG